jgi:hypothetical protein
VIANIAERGGAQNGVCQGVPGGVGIRMAFELGRMRDLHAAEGDMVAGFEGVNVKALADARGGQGGGEQT